MPVGRRIYGFADDNTFYAFRDRAKQEGLTVADAFTAIVKAYATGHVLVRPKPVSEHTKGDGAHYILDRVSVEVPDGKRA